MKVYYDSADNNQVKAIYSSNTASAAWDSYSSIEVTNENIAKSILDLMPCCQVVITDNIVTAVVESHPQDVLRARLSKRVADEYDQWVENGVPVPVSWTEDTLIVMPWDVPLLEGVLGIGTSKLARGIIQDNAVILNFFKFGNGVVKMNVIHKDVEELNEGYQTVFSQRFVAHYTVKASIDAGVMPTQANYESVGLTSSDFDGLGLA